MNGNDQPGSETGTGTGFYGKLPGLGDFVSRRLPSQLLQPWDQWLRECMAASQSQLGDDWLDAYLTSPLWRFVLTPGIAGQTGWAGVLMPSVDRVGRYFPLTLAVPLPGLSDPFRVLCGADWFERAEALALSGLDDDAALDAFDAQAQALPAPPVPPAPATATLPALAARTDAWHLRTAGPADLMAACPTLLARAIEEVFFAYSLWSTAGSQRVAPCLLACQGLPPPDAYSALLVGDWSDRGWRSVG